MEAIAAFSSKAVQDYQAAEERNTKILKEMEMMQVEINKIQDGGNGGGGGGKPKPDGDRGPTFKATT